MIKRAKHLFLFLILGFLTNCSFDNKTGIWSGIENEKKRILDLENKQNRKIEVVKIYTQETIFDKEIVSTKRVVLTEVKKNSSWQMSGLNLQNFLGNIYLPNIDNNFLKKKIGKKKYLLSKIKLSPLTFEDSIFITDDTGSIYRINKNGKVYWKSNIYKKIYKKIYKNLSFSIYKDKIYVADNIGYVYAISFETGKLIWIKNHGIPLKSKIKIFENRIYLINQDNRLLCLNIDEGSLIWDNRSISSFIKTQNFLALAISGIGNLVTLDSSGNLLKLKANNGGFYWSLSMGDTQLVQGSNFFESSDITIVNNDIFFSTPASFFSFNLDNGYLNWKKNIVSKNTPIIDGNNVFIVSDNGYFVNLDKQSGKIVWSTNILKILKKKKQKTEITGFVMGSGKIYAVSLNGYLIVSSALSGKVEYFKKVADSITSAPIISNGSLYILTGKSKILGFN